MSIKTTIIMLIIIYLIMVLINSLKVHGTSAHVAGPFIILIGLFLGYAVLSITATVKLYNTGVFQWISTNPGILKIALFAGTACMIYAVFSAIMIRADWSTYQNQSISDPKDFLAYTSHIWVPLLMIIPYTFVLLNKNGDFQQNWLFKLPLILLVLIGAGVYTYLHSGSLRYVFSAKQNENDYYAQQTIEKIKSSTSIKDYFYYTLPSNDKKISDAAFLKLKADTTWENKIYKYLEDCSEVSFQITIHQFLSVYKVDNPEKLMEPFGKSLRCISEEAINISENEFTSGNDLNVLAIENSLLAIEKQFVGKEKTMFESLAVLEDTLKKIEREDFKQKTGELLKLISELKQKFL